MKKIEIIEQAAKLVGGDRNDAYGDATQSHARIARYWSAYLGRELSALDVAIMMILFKVARAQGNSKREDSYVDIAGYAGIAGEIATNAL